MKKHAEKLVPDKLACTLLHLPGEICYSRVSLKLVKWNNAERCIAAVCWVVSGRFAVPSSTGLRDWFIRNKLSYKKCSWCVAFPRDEEIEPQGPFSVRRNKKAK